jgi:guanyl-specific ribonuclease Sa
MYGLPLIRLIAAGAGFLLSALAALTIATVPFLPVQAAPVAEQSARIPVVSIQQLPPEARTTIDLIRNGGPFPYRQDGTVFGNRERRLPLNPPGYYREYTVKTPGVRGRGARRIVSGQKGELYYTRDHYASFYFVRVR